MDKNIVISTRTIFVTLTLLFALWLLIQIKTIILALFVSLILALGLAPLVDWLVKRKISRGLAVILLYLFLIFLFLTLGIMGISPIVEQTAKLFQQLPNFLDSLVKIPGLERYFYHFSETLTKEITRTSGGVLRATLGAFTSALTGLTIFVFTAYLLLDFENLKERFLFLFPKGDRGKVEKIVGEIEVKLGTWLRSQLLLCFIVGLFTFVGLLALRVDYALSLALIAGILEVVPNIGPILSCVPAAIVGFSTSSLTGFGVLALFILVQQLENNLIVPTVMKKAVGFNPLVTILVILIGGRLFGILGVLLAIPTTLVAVIVIKELLAWE